jgi:hypothetical protein
MMIACSNGRERNLDELAALCAAARLEVGRVFHHAMFSIVEARAVG